MPQCATWSLPQAGHVLAAKFSPDSLGGSTKPMIALQVGRAADAVAPEQADDLAIADVKVDAMQDVALAVIGVQVAALRASCGVQRPQIRFLHRSGWRAPPAGGPEAMTCP